MTQSSLMLVLKVLNTANIESGCSAHSVFDQNGGTIGYDKSCHWVIQDNRSNISSNHLKVFFYNNYYCVQVLGNNNISINDASITEKSGFIRLKTDDVILIGTIKLKVYLQDSSSLDLCKLDLEPLDIIGNNEDYLKKMIGDDGVRYKSNHTTNPHTIDDSVNLDPLIALDKKDNLTTLQNSQVDLLPIEVTQNKSDYSQNEAVNMNTNSNFMDLPNPNESHVSSEYIENAYVTISPLLREMNSNISLENSQDINDILTEIGKTLKASIEGLLTLQQSQNSLNDKHLRPIEDNPLRLGLDYSSTMNILFGDQKSPVHLSAPAAVSESLNNLLMHNNANKLAITAALTAILSAFSPQMLLSRFENYRRSYEIQDSNPAWAWSMYENYYRELTSTRQHGFEKLFWEVYAQAYDKALRDQDAK